MDRGDLKLKHVKQDNTQNPRRISTKLQAASYALSHSERNGKHSSQLNRSFA